MSDILMLTSQPLTQNTTARNGELNRWYLAYGSNLSSETFQGRRGIRPLAQSNVTAPSLELTFDLPGIPYLEPCFANVRRRKNPDASAKEHPLLIGVAYLVTAKDYARIIATEGGGLSYEEVVVECRRLPILKGEMGCPGVRVGAVQEDPTEPIFASTLLAPDNRRRESPMQPSKRYIDIIRTGARENNMPASYIEYLDSITYYRTTSILQRVGASLFLAMWLPPLSFIFLLHTIFADAETGRLPNWLGVLSGAVTSTMWGNYERVWKRAFGSGEVTAGSGTLGSEDLEYGEKGESSEGAATNVHSAHIDFYYL